MSFVEPLFLGGLLAAAIPLVIHLVNRRKATRQEFPALRLLMESNKKEASSIKVRQWLLLSLRVLLVAALAFALAKPFFLSDHGVTASGRLPTAVVFVVDDSASMQHAGWWSAAGDRFEAQVAKLRPWDEAALITTSDTDGPVARLTSDHGELQDVFSELSPTDASTDLSEAVVAAADVLSASQLPSKRIVVISDFARGGFPQDPNPDQAVPYELLRVSVRDEPGETPANLGVVSVDYQQEQTGQESTWKVTATVKNWGATPKKGVELRLVIDGKNIAGGLVDVPAGDTSTHTFRHHFAGSGLRRAVVELADDDALNVDNRYYFVVNLKQRIRVLLVNGEPSSVPYSDELYFLVRALHPGSAGAQSRIIPEMTTTDGFGERILADYDVVVLANVAAVNQSRAKRLQQFVDAGGGLMVTMGDQVDAASWNQTMDGLLPKPIRGMKRLAEKDDPDAPVKITHLGPGHRDHPIFRIFELPGGSSLQSVDVYSYSLLEPAQRPNTREILAFDDKAPALIERTIGDGRVVMLTTTVDREWTDLPVRTAFLPLMRRSIQYLARRAASAGKDRPTVGERVTREVTGLVDDRAIIHGPDDLRRVIEPADGSVSFVADAIGFYQLWADSDAAQNGSEGDSDTPRNRLDGLAFAANLDSAESQLAPLGDDAFDPWTAGGADDDPPGRSEGDKLTAERRVNVWPPILFAITIMLLLETLVGSRRSVLARVWRRIVFQDDPEVQV